MEPTTYVQHTHTRTHNNNLDDNDIMIYPLHRLRSPSFTRCHHAHRFSLFQRVLLIDFIWLTKLLSTLIVQ